MAVTTSGQRPARLPDTADRAGFPGALRSELTKLGSVRSSYWTLLALAVLVVGFSVLGSAAAASHPGQNGPGFDPTARSLFGLYVGQLIIAALGALTVTAEYSTGMIATSLTALPRRPTIFAAKAAAFALVALGTGLVTSFAAFFTGQAVMARVHINATLTQPGVLRAVTGGALFLAVCGLLAYGLGTLLRHTAGAITATVLLLFVATLLVNTLPQSWQDRVDKWLPALAGGQIWATRPAHGPPLFAPWTGFAVFCGYAAIAMTAGLISFTRRDA